MLLHTTSQLVLPGFYVHNTVLHLSRNKSRGQLQEVQPLSVQRSNAPISLNTVCTVY